VSDTLELLANLGAEESDWTRMVSHPRVRTVARLWAALFPADARLVGPGAPEPPRLAGALAHTQDEPALAELCFSPGALVPWLSTIEARSLAQEHGLTLAACDPDIVRYVHDKAFAHHVALETGLIPESLADSTLVLHASELTSARDVRARIAQAVALWPDALRARFTVKPRIGTSGRGRVSGVDGDVSEERLANALPRLRAAGGAIVEPWLDRVADVSAQLHIASATDVRVLGTLRQLTSEHGAPLGHAGEIGCSGHVSSGLDCDEALRVAASLLGLAAAQQGFRGVCGVDALLFRNVHGHATLRPVVELNARFTMGTVALGHVARARRAGLVEGAATVHVGAIASAWECAYDREIPLLEDDRSVLLRVALAT